MKNNTCKNCRWWQNTHNLQPEQGDCGNPAVVDISGSLEGEGFGIRVNDRDLMTEPRFGCIHHVALPREAKTPLNPDKAAWVAARVRESVSEDLAAETTRGVVFYLEGLDAEEQKALLLEKHLLKHVIGVAFSRL